jgi:hypothetical protein
VKHVFHIPCTCSHVKVYPSLCIFSVISINIFFFGILQPLSESAPSTSAQPVFWNDEATKLLIAEMRAREEKSNSGKITKKKMFIEITEKMHKEGYTFTTFALLLVFITCNF